VSQLSTDQKRRAGPQEDFPLGGGISGHGSGIWANTERKNGVECTKLYTTKRRNQEMASKCDRGGSRGERGARGKDKREPAERPALDGAKGARGIKEENGAAKREKAKNNTKKGEPGGGKGYGCQNATQAVPFLYETERRMKGSGGRGGAKRKGRNNEKNPAWGGRHAN